VYWGQGLSDKGLESPRLISAQEGSFGARQASPLHLICNHRDRDRRERAVRCRTRSVSTGYVVDELGCSIVYGGTKAAMAQGMSTAEAGA
jgi:hypothetical protein